MMKQRMLGVFYKEFIKSKKEKCDELYGDIGGVKRAKMGNWSSEDDENINTLVARRKRRKKTEKMSPPERPDEMLLESNQMSFDLSHKKSSTYSADADALLSLKKSSTYSADAEVEKDFCKGDRHPK